ncbi:peptidase c45 [Anaeramoeba flamelloides]|uniref:Peptidase c45 n=1 Tax=Anaeramoeba flamelloides TaxID=1746091 RepID=A0ABQ8X1A0_9EUKA|nr:peptidase c45 [Anaeramoeba flamelloides]
MHSSKSNQILITFFFFLFFLIWQESCSSVPTSEKPFPEFHIKGSNPYWIGKQVGQYGRDMIREFVSEYKPLKDKLIPWYNENKDLYNKFLVANTDYFPNYVSELVGLSEATDIPFYQIFLLTMESEISLIIRGETNGHDHGIADNNSLGFVGSKACSDVHVNSDEFIGFGHNEDGDLLVKNTSFIIYVDQTFKNTGGEETTLKYFAYVYPSYIWGLAFGCNNHRMCYSGNAIFPKKVQVGALKLFLYRSMLDITSIDNAIEVLQSAKPASGLSINLGDLDQKETVNIEVSTEGINVKKIQPNEHYFHFNMFRRVDVAQYDDTSSIERLKRADEMTPPTTMKQIAQILGDHTNADYPIYRNGNPPDTDIETLTTVLMDLNNEKCSMYSGNPYTDFDNPWKVIDLNTIFDESPKNE